MTRSDACDIIVEADLAWSATIRGCSTERWTSKRKFIAHGANAALETAGNRVSNARPKEQWVFFDLRVFCAVHRSDPLECSVVVARAIITTATAGSLHIAFLA
jgi:hypothetical protein